ncbi:MAG: GGDEF domain-containing protein [Planctomycetota bacterium]
MGKVLGVFLPVLGIAAAGILAGVMLRTEPGSAWREAWGWGAVGVTLAAAGWSAYLGVLVLRRDATRREIEREREAALRMVEAQDGRLRHLRSQVELLTAMRELSRVSTDETRFDEVLKELIRIVEGITRAEEAAIFLVEGEGEPVPAVYIRRGEVTTSGYVISEAVDTSLVAASFRERAIRKGGDEEFLALAAPLLADNALIGILYAGISMEGPAQARRREAEAAEGDVRDISTHLAITLQHTYRARLAVRDRLTNLYNRAKLLEDLRGQFREDGSRVCGTPCALLMMDIDHFKQVNDKRGHLAGDEVLKGIADAIAGSMRRGESAYRYGGEEFAALLPRATIAEAAILAERIRARAALVKTKVGRHTIQVTLSAGVACADATVRNAEALIASADQALYRAKKAGRNRVEVQGGGEGKVNAGRG